MRRLLLIFGMIQVILLTGIGIILVPSPAQAYPPAVGILGPSRNCLTCHVSNGPWKDDAGLIIDIVDKSTGKSIKQKDGNFLLTVKPGKARTLLTIIGVKRGSYTQIPYRNAWLYVDPNLISDKSALNKFAPGWEVDLPMSCRLVGDPVEMCPEDEVTMLPMTVKAGSNAKESEIELQIMLTTGESVKGKAKEGMTGNYFERKLKLKLEE